MNKKLVEAINSLEKAVVRLETRLESITQDYSRRLDRLENGFIWSGSLLAGLIVSGVVGYFFFKG